MLVEFTLQDDACRLMLGLVYDRIYKFFQKYDPLKEHEALVQQILLRLLQPDNTAVKLLLYVDQGYLTGHMLLSLEQEQGKPVVYIHQLEFNSAVLTPQLTAEMLEYTAKFGAANGAEQLIMSTTRNPRVWHKYYGFKTNRTILTRSIASILQHQPLLRLVRLLHPLQRDRLLVRCLLCRIL